ncbi:MAG: twin-arginine translocase TatA/TatE family subunit [Acidimicrobiaceae bacterium]|nr:twin-arginine translocase TatA/TatE family subunit [Acidimicrobiaceae bacterium]MBO0747420.1 twin-arginine translocase TatA/TatE family subunit [Acidimicrobiaceae bacterium]
MNFSPEKLFLVGIIALVVLGPNRLPQAARTVGRLLAEFRRMSANVQNEFTQALADPRDAMQKSIGEFGFTDVRSQLRSTINEVVTGPRTNGNGALNGSHAAGAIEAADGLGGDVGSPIVDPSRMTPVGTLEDQTGAPASQLQDEPVAPDDPSFN